ncbi:hypothetical protein AB0383_17130 [Amycolatopsis sp. NPDC051373]|uniref:hypothetical protein n=1 Tax=Amycolatopsis sp. NPDC051373 TaxID=3155801 RepID=UPI00344F95C0
MMKPEVQRKCDRRAGDLPLTIWALLPYTVSGKTRTYNMVKLIKAVSIAIICVLLVIAAVIGGALVATGHVADGLLVAGSAVGTPLASSVGWKTFIKTRDYLRGRREYPAATELRPVDGPERGAA